MLATRTLQTIVFAFAVAGMLAPSATEAAPSCTDPIPTVVITAKRLGIVGKNRMTLQDAQAAAKPLAGSETKSARVRGNLG